MKVARERFEACVGHCSRRQGLNCIIEDEDVYLCIFDEGFLLGYEAGVESVTPKALRITLTPGLTPGTPVAN